MTRMIVDDETENKRMMVGGEVRIAVGCVQVRVVLGRKKKMAASATGMGGSQRTGKGWDGMIAVAAGAVGIGVGGGDIRSRRRGLEAKQCSYWRCCW